MKKNISKYIFFIFLVIFGLLLVQFYVAQFQNQREPLLGKAAPHFEVENLQGETFKLQDVLGKKVVLVNFWATWCAPCREEVPILNEISKSLDASEFVIVGLMEDEEPTKQAMQEALDRFKRKIPIDFDVYIDKLSQVADLYGTYKIPESYLIDKEGKVIRHYVGSITELDKNEIIQIVKDL